VELADANTALAVARDEGAAAGRELARVRAKLRELEAEAEAGEKGKQASALARCRELLHDRVGIT